MVQFLGSYPCCSCNHHHPLDLCLRAGQQESGWAQPKNFRCTPQSVHNVISVLHHEHSHLDNFLAWVSGDLFRVGSPPKTCLLVLSSVCVSPERATFPRDSPDGLCLHLNPLLLGLCRYAYLYFHIEELKAPEESDAPAAIAASQVASVATIVNDNVALILAQGLSCLLGLRSIPGVIVWLVNGYCEMIRGVARKDGEIGGIEEERYKLSPQMNSALREEIVMCVIQAPCACTSCLRCAVATCCTRADCLWIGWHCDGFAGTLRQVSKSCMNHQKQQVQRTMS